MANTSRPDGKWLQTSTKAHWLNYATIIADNEFTGNEHIQLQAEIRNKVAAAANTLSEHNIKIFNIYTMKDHDPNNWDTIHRIAIGFEHEEDLVLAKLILQCNV